MFFPSISHKKGVHRIVRGLESNCGLILLTGEIGVGKTSLARHIQRYLSDRFAFIELGNPYQTPLEQVYFCCEQFGVDTQGISTIHDCIKKLEGHFRTLLKEGKRPVIVFDEGHLLTKRHLSLIHILSNIRAEDVPLVQILLVGQLEILDLLATVGMEALNQRIGVRCQLSPLGLEDTDRYIEFKIEKNGQPELVVFAKEAIKLIWKESGGLPRVINHVCAHALDALAFKDTNVVTSGMVDEVCRESVYAGMFQTKTSKTKKKRNWLPWGAGGCVALLIIIVAVWFVVNQGEKSQVVNSAERNGAVRQSVKPQASVEPAKPQVTAGSIADDVGEDVSSVERPTKVAEPFSPSKGEIDDSGASEFGATEVVVVVEEPVHEEVKDVADAKQEKGTSLPPLAEIADGNMHPVIGELVLGAIAWNEDPQSSFAVVNSKLLHEGELVDGVRLIKIGEDYILFEYTDGLYKRTFSRK